MRLILAPGCCPRHICLTPCRFAPLTVLIVLLLAAVPAWAQQDSDTSAPTKASKEVAKMPANKARASEAPLTDAQQARIDSLELQASFAVVAENHDVVVRNLTKVLEVVPGDSSHYFLLGNAYDGLWQYANAAAAYREAINRGMDGPEVRLARARSLATSRRYADAYPIVNDLLKASPSNVGLRLTYANIMSGLGRASEVVDDLDTLYGMYPDESGIMGRYTETLWVAGEQQRAFNTITAYIEEHPEEPFPYTLLAEMHLRVGNVADGHAAFLKANDRLKQRSSYVRGIVNSGLTYTLAKNGQPKEALERSDAAIEQMPNNPYLYRNRGMAYLADGQRDAACASFQESLERGYERLFLRETQFGPEPSTLIKQHCQ